MKKRDIELYEYRDGNKTYLYDKKAKSDSDARQICYAMEKERNAAYKLAAEALGEAAVLCQIGFE